jgi:hypothetical protein
MTFTSGFIFFFDSFNSYVIQQLWNKPKLMLQMNEMDRKYVLSVTPVLLLLIAKRYLERHGIHDVVLNKCQ